jgi:hypothetical protein
MRRFLLTVVLALSVVSGAFAQSPQTEPVLQPSSFVYQGSFTLPNTDGTGTPGDSDLIQYGGNGLGIGPSNTLFYGCYREADTIVQTTIPAIGAQATVVTPCRFPLNLNAVDGTDGGARTIGGTLWWNDRLIVTGHAYYDADQDAVASHFAGTTFLNLTGPYTMADGLPGIKGGPMTPVPTQWRTLVGGPALTSLYGVSIVDRSSYGPTASVFDPDDVGVVNPIPSTTLMKYTFAVPFPLMDWRAIGIGSLMWPSGYRTVMFMQRVGTGTPCYGTGGASGGTCYDPTGSYNGFHSYPYVIRGWLVDGNHLAEVKAGTRLSTSIVPIGYIDFPEVTAVSGAAEFTNMTYDEATRKMYVVTAAGGVQPRVHVYLVNAATQPPVDATYGPWTEYLPVSDWTICDPTGHQTRLTRRTREELTPAQNGGNTQPISEEQEEIRDCDFNAVLSDWTVWTSTEAWTACAVDGSGGIQTRNETRSRTVLQPAVNNGTTGSLSEAREGTQACTPPTLPAPTVCTVLTTGSPFADGDARLLLVRCDTNGQPLPSVFIVKD